MEKATLTAALRAADLSEADVLRIRSGLTLQRSRLNGKEQRAWHDKRGRPVTVPGAARAADKETDTAAVEAPRVKLLTIS